MSCKPCWCCASRCLWWSKTAPIRMPMSWTPAAGTCLHWMRPDAPLATCRLIPAGQSQRHAEAATTAIGRLAVAQQARGSGMGRALMQEALRQLAQLSPGPVRIAAQQHLQGFYESLGFVAVSSPYLEDNIPHLDMLKH